MVIQGRELGQFVNDFIWYLRNLMLIRTSDDSVEDIIDASAERLEALKNEAAMVDTDIIMRYIRVLSELSGQMKYSSQKRVLVEIALIKLNQPSMERDQSSLNNRIALLEKKIESGDFVAARPAGEIPMPAQQAKPKKVWDKAVPSDIQYVVDNWGAVQRHISQPYKQFLNGARFSVKGEDTLLIVFEGFAATGFGACNKPEVIEMLNTIIGEEIQKQVKVEMKLLETNQNFNDYYQEVISHINMEIEEEDF
jgi:DNA polymerase-3 subunit gamma/tau